MSGRSGGSAATSNRISQSQLASSQRTDEDITAPAHLQVSHSEEVSLVGSGDAHAVQGTVPDAGEQGSDDELLVSENERDDVVHAPDERHTPPSSDREVPSVESARGERAVHESSEPNSGREPDPEGPLEGSARAADEERKPPSSEREAPSVESARGGGDADESNRASAQVHAELDESLARRTKEHPAREVTPDAARHPMREPAGNERTTWLPTQNQTNEDFRPSGVEMASARLTETPLYVIKDEEYRQKETKAKQAKERRVMAERHNHHRPVDWIALDREAKRRARQVAQETMHVPIVKPDRRSHLKVPPLTRNYYAGEHLRAEREKYNRFLNSENDARAAAVRRRQAAMRYAAETKQQLRQGAMAPVRSRSPSPPPRPIRRMSGPEDTTADKTFPHTKAGLFPAVRMHQGLDTIIPAPMEPAPDAGQVKMLAMKATQLNHKVGHLERQLQATTATVRGSVQRDEDAALRQHIAKGVEADWPTVLRTSAVLCSTYIEAITTKLQLLEALRAA